MERRVLNCDHRHNHHYGDHNDLDNYADIYDTPHKYASNEVIYCILSAIIDGL